MQRLLPVDPSGAPPAEIPLDPAAVDELIAAEDRPGRTGRPWVVANMVASADGATYVDGVSGPIGADGDRAVFLALRAVADVVLAGSATVTAERYRLPMGSPERRRRRIGRGQAPLPRLAVISNRGDIDLTLPLFSEAAGDRRPLVLVAEGVPEDRRRELDEVSEVLVAGSERVDIGAAIVALAARTAAGVVLVEGGATLNGLLLEDDLFDEWCITVAPVLTGGDANRASLGPPPGHLRHMRLDRVLEHEGELMLRYVRVRDAGATAAGP